MTSVRRPAGAPRRRHPRRPAARWTCPATGRAPRARSSSTATFYLSYRLRQPGGRRARATPTSSPARADGVTFDDASPWSTKDRVRRRVPGAARARGAPTDGPLAALRQLRDAGHQALVGRRRSRPTRPEGLARRRAGTVLPGRRPARRQGPGGASRDGGRLAPLGVRAPARRPGRHRPDDHRVRHRARTASTGPGRAPRWRPRPGRWDARGVRISAVFRVGDRARAPPTTAAPPRRRTGRSAPACAARDRATAGSCARRAPPRSPSRRTAGAGCATCRVVDLPDGGVPAVLRGHPRRRRPRAAHRAVGVAARRRPERDGRHEPARLPARSGRRRPGTSALHARARAAPGAVPVRRSRSRSSSSPTARRPTPGAGPGDVETWGEHVWRRDGLRGALRPPRRPGALRGEAHRVLPLRPRRPAAHPRPPARTRGWSRCCATRSSGRTRTGRTCARRASSPRPTSSRALPGSSRSAATPAGRTSGTTWPRAATASSSTTCYGLVRPRAGAAAALPRPARRAGARPPTASARFLGVETGRVERVPRHHVRPDVAGRSVAARPPAERAAPLPVVRRRRPRASRPTPAGISRTGCADAHVSTSECWGTPKCSRER